MKSWLHDIVLAFIAATMLWGILYCIWWPLNLVFGK
jgi:hypothetical protein